MMSLRFGVQLPGSILLQVRAESPGKYTAQIVGLPELQATASTRHEAIQQVQALMQQLLIEGQLEFVPLPSAAYWCPLPARIDPNDPDHQEYLKELERLRQEDLENTLREYAVEDQRCSPDSSSTPIT